MKSSCGSGTGSKLSDVFLLIFLKILLSSFSSSCLVSYSNLFGLFACWGLVGSIIGAAGGSMAATGDLRGTVLVDRLAVLLGASVWRMVESAEVTAYVVDEMLMSLVAVVCKELDSLLSIQIHNELLNILQ